MMTMAPPPVPIPKHSLLPIWRSSPTPRAQGCLLLKAVLCGKSPVHAVGPAVSRWTWVLCTHCCVPGTAATAQHALLLRDMKGEL